MATFDGTNYAKSIDPSGSNVLAQGLWGARVRVQSDSYTFVSKASGSVVQVGKLPEGARVLAVVVNHGTGSASFTLAIGNGGSGQGAIFAAAIASTTATVSPRVSMLAANSGYVVGTLTGDDIITLTTGGATSHASQVVTVDTLYTVD